MYIRWVAVIILTSILLCGAIQVHDCLVESRDKDLDSRAVWPSVEEEITGTRTDITDGILLTVLFKYKIYGIDFTSS